MRIVLNRDGEKYVNVKDFLYMIYRNIAKHRNASAKYGFADILQGVADVIEKFEPNTEEELRKHWDENEEYEEV